MMLRSHFALCLLLAACLLTTLSLPSCHKKAAQDQSSADDSGQGLNVYTPDQDEQDRIRQNIEKGLLGDSTMFPYVFAGPDRSLIFQAYSMSFTLQPQPALVGMLNQMVPWVDPQQYNEYNGLFATYVRNGRKLSLEQPYIQVQYINKNLPYCSTLDSIFLWMDERFLQLPDAKLLRKRTVLSTQGGPTVTVQDYFTGYPEEGTPGVAKWVANGYLEYDENYWLAFGLSTTSKDDYDLTQTLFDDLVKSFRFY